MRRRVLAAAGVLMAVIVLPAPARADPAVPTNYRSRVTGTVPADGLRAEVVGGDAFLRLTVEGRRVVVLGYEGEPYLRFHGDGTVERNRRSSARWLNAQRYARVDVPDDVDVGGPPEWETVATDGSWSWHDHRIHWMSPFPPEPVAAGSGRRRVTIFDWEVPLVVDGRPGVVRGTLEWIPDPSPFPALVAAAFVAIGVSLVRTRGAAAALVVAGALAGVAAAGTLLVQPADARTGGPDIVVPAVVVALGALGGWRGTAAPRVAAAALALVWSWERIDDLLRPLVPTALPVFVDRAAVVGALGVALGVVGAWLVRSRSPGSGGLG